MLESILVILAPIISIAIFWLFENIKAGRVSLNKRYITIISLAFFGLGLNVFLTIYLLEPIVNIYSHFEIFSIMEIPAPLPVNIILSFLLIDLANYIIHVLHHKIPLLWRLHRLHHSDKQVDVFTAVFHHPLEIFSSFLLFILFFVMFDIPVVFLIYYSVAHAVVSTWSHSSFKLPGKLDSYFRLLFVTPNMHIVHHSLDMKEGNSNFGAIFSVWDRIFGSYTKKTTGRLLYGIAKEQSPKSFKFKELLVNPNL